MKDLTPISPDFLQPNVPKVPPSPNVPYQAFSKTSKFIVETRPRRLLIIGAIVLRIVCVTPSRCDFSKF